MYPIPKEEYPLLHLFKHQIELDRSSPDYKPYTFHKTPVLLYKGIFISIGTIYAVIASVLLIKTLSWTCGFLFGSNMMVKAVLLSICGLIAASSLWIGFFMTPEKEAIKKVMKRGREKLERVYARKRIQHSLKRFFAFGVESRKSTAFKQHYYETLCKLFEAQDETIHLVNRIARTPTLSPNSREELFNQALIELKQRIHEIILSFESSYPSKLFFN